MKSVLVKSVTSSSGGPVANRRERLTQRRPKGCWCLGWKVGNWFNHLRLFTHRCQQLHKEVKHTAYSFRFATHHSSCAPSPPPSLRQTPFPTMTKHYTKSFTPQEKQAAIAKYADHIKYSARYSGRWARSGPSQPSTDTTSLVDEQYEYRFV